MTQKTVIIPIMPEPAFRGCSDTNLSCECGHILVEGYEPRKLIGIYIKCFQCGHITRTEQWPDNEPLPHNAVTLGDNGNFYISRTIVITKDAAFTCDQEIYRITTLNAARQENLPPLSLTVEGIDEIVRVMNGLTDGLFSNCIDSTKRAFDRGNVTFMEYPLAWAIIHVREKVLSRRIVVPMDEVDRIAISYILLFRHLISRWSHHVLFRIISSQLCGEFFHTITMLVAASYMQEHGNRIGITDTYSEIGNSPDLFINSGPTSRLSIEVKAPDAFFWPSRMPSLSEAERRIARVINNSVTQITGNLGGVYIIGAYRPEPEFTGIFKRALDSIIINNPIINSRVAAIVGVTFSPSDISGLGLFHEPQIEQVTQISPRLNPRYEMENPIRIGTKESDSIET